MPELLQPITPSTLYYGDCLEVMELWRPEQVDLIYLDPPFNSNVNYNILFGTKSNGKTGQLMAFEDTWSWDRDAVDRVKRLKARKASPIWSAMDGLERLLGPSGMLSYLSYMAERLEQCKRLLKPSGSIYLHCDATASHYLKVVMDSIFGAKSFRREIVWHLRAAAGFKGRVQNWVRGHDTILYYAKGQLTFNKLYLPYDKEQLKRFSGKDEHGDRYKVITKDRRLYLKDAKGVPATSVWSDIASFQTVVNSKEKLGYPTQKPSALLKRIIQASSKKGDLVLDPFCGCGTTVVAAEELNRRWVGIDISAFAVETIMRERLRRAGVDVQTEGIPMDMESARLLARKPLKFEQWAINQVPGLAPNEKQVGDRGVDGRGTCVLETEDGRDGVIAQVKAGGVQITDVRAFLRAMETENAVAGVFITLTRGVVTRGMREEADSLGSFTIPGSPHEYPRVQFWSMEEWFAHDKDRRFLPHLPPMRNPLTGEEMQRTLYEA